MRYPVSATGTKEAFEKDWYIAQEFGKATTYGFHEGVDINLKTGGDTDFNQELKAIAKGKIIYYHYMGHPTSGFGRHLVLKIDGAWGTRWVHYAHCNDLNFTASVKDVNEGDIIARLGKSGNSPSAHLHFAIFRVDPASVGGIDNFANNLTELNSVWEDPIKFINTWSQPIVTPPVNDQSKYDFGIGFGVLELQQARGIMQDQKKNIDNLNLKINQAKVALG
jgi:murein DD-endopeptidase MepM/ murein hydrolase activator NlpD